MKHLRSLFLIVLFLCCSVHLAVAQDNVNDLLKQGVAFHKQGKYTEAIEKFTEALKADPENGYAHYEIAYSLYASKKPKDALPHLLTAVKSPKPTISVPAYSLLATIYDEGGQRPEATAAYTEAIKINPDYPQIYYNLGIVYFGNKQYAEAEGAAIEAIKHDPKNASSQRLYALVTFHQNKRANALLALCSFILLEPKGPRAIEAYNNIQHIMQGGILKDANGNTVVGVSIKDDPETGTLNTDITLAVQSAKTKNLSGVALLEHELKTIFTIAGQLSEKKKDKNFFDRFFAAYFYKLAQSPNMPALVHTIISDDKWLTANPAQANALTEWIKATGRDL